MFERFTERSRQVVVLAQEEARNHHRDYVGTEHLLLGLLREEEGLAARVLAGLGVGLDGARDLIAEHKPVDLDAESPPQIPFTARAKKALEYALREALALGHNYIGTEHVLLGLSRIHEGEAYYVLRTFGQTRGTVHDAIVKLLSGKPRTEPHDFSEQAVIDHARGLRRGVTVREVGDHFRHDERYVREVMDGLVEGGYLEVCYRVRRAA